MEDENERFCLFPRTQSQRQIWYYYIYYEDGNRKYRSTGLSNKAKAKAFVMKKYKEGTLFEKKNRDILFRDFAKPFWIWETCPIINSKVKRGGNLTKGYCKARATVGHESADITKHYLHLLPSDMKRVLDVAKQIENL